MVIRSDSNNAAIVPFLLTEDNYEDWRIYIENYLLAQDLWDTVESGDVDLVSSLDDVGNWRKKTAAALHAIHTTSSPDVFAQIKEIRSAKDAWYKLAKMHQERQFEGTSETGVQESGGGEKVEMTGMPHCKGSNGGEDGDQMIEKPYYVELKNCICKGDWNGVKQLLVFHKYLLNARIISDKGYTALHVAIKVGQDKIAQKLLKKMSKTDLEIKTISNGDTVLSLVAMQGRTHVAKRIVQKNSKLLIIKNDRGHIPVGGACAVGHKEMTEYLYSVTPPQVLLSQNGIDGYHLIRWGIANKMLDICYDLLQHNPSLSVVTNEELQGESPILTLSRQPSAFFSGSTLSFWQRWIYHWLKVKLPTNSSREVRITVTQHHQSDSQKNIKIKVFDRLRGLGSMLFNFFGIKQIYDMKLRHFYAFEILRCMCGYVSTLKVQPRFDCGVVEAIFKATKHGMVEFVIELLKVNQPLIYRNKHRRDVFMIAIQYRQENIFNLFYGIHEAWKARFLNHKDERGNNMLHVAGEIASDFRLARISSTALQMQRELQWFKEVERIVPEWCKEAKNRNGETPYEVFSKSHKELVKEGAKWMKDTANSFIIVGTLIVTIMFAAAFTVPGGNDQNTGFPIFLQKRSFMIFIISDAISFFAALTSVLMFLGILTSRFAQEDFLVSLPKKLIIGLSTLFISIAAMMVSFCAALLAMLQNRWWAIFPIILMAGIPITLFVWLQFPLLVEIFVSTYASRIFDRKMKPWL